MTRAATAVGASSGDEMTDIVKYLDAHVVGVGLPAVEQGRAADHVVLADDQACGHDEALVAVPAESQHLQQQERAIQLVVAWARAGCWKISP
jgi:hypothetical protein